VRIAAQGQRIREDYCWRPGGHCAQVSRARAGRAAQERHHRRLCGWFLGVGRCRRCRQAPGWAPGGQPLRHWCRSATF